MAERAIVEYVANCAWQIPLLAAGAWVLVKPMRPGALAQHWLWLSVLAMAVVLPGCGTRESSIVRSVTINPSPVPVAGTREQSPLGGPLKVGHGFRTTKFLRPVEGESVPLPFARRNLVLSSTATRSLVALYMLAVFLGGLRLVRGFLAARRLARRSRAAVLCPQTMRVLEDSCLRLKVAMPRMRESEEIDGPVVLCAMRPVMVLPCGFETHAEEEVRAALLHELAHVRRRDYLVNLVCQIVALPVAWHPAVYAIQQKIRRTREMVCDAIAAGEMESGAEYARCLMSLARQMVNGASMRGETQAMGLFGDNTMEERVMNLTEAKSTVSGRARVLRGLCGCAAMVVVAGAATTFHVRPTFAATPIVRAEKVSTEGAVQDAALAQTAEKTPPAATAPASAEPMRANPSEQAPAASSASASTSATVDEDEPTAVAGEGGYVHRWVAADGKKYVIVNHNPKEPNEEERLREEQKLKDAEKDLEQMKLDRSMMNSQSDKLEKDFASMSVSRQQMRDLQRQIAQSEKNAQLDLAKSPEWQKQMQEMQRRINDPAWQKQIAEMEKNAQLKMMDSPEWKKQFAELEKNAPEFKFNFDFEKQMALANNAAMDEAKLNATIAKAMKGNAEQMAKMQKEMESGELKAKLDEATRLLEEVRKKMEAMQAK